MPQTLLAFHLLELLRLSSATFLIYIETISPLKTLYGRLSIISKKTVDQQSSTSKHQAIFPRGTHTPDTIKSLHLYLLWHHTPGNQFKKLRTVSSKILRLF